jgi:hypothetical protein
MLGSFEMIGFPRFGQAQPKYMEKTYRFGEFGRGI